MIELQRWSRLCPVSLLRQLRISVNDAGPSRSGTTQCDVPPHYAHFSKQTGWPDELTCYLREHQLTADLHQQFWHHNNQRFSMELHKWREQCQIDDSCGKVGAPHVPDESVFYRFYMEKHQEEFQAYHKATWRRAFAMLMVEYRWIAFQIGHTMRSLYSSLQGASRWEGSRL